MEQRLRVLFENDEELLQLDTGLTHQSTRRDPGLEIPQPAEPSPQDPQNSTESTEQDSRSEDKMSEWGPRYASKIHELELQHAFVPARATPKLYQYFLSPGQDLYKMVAQTYFEGDRIWQRTWDLYDLALPSGGCLSFLPALQVKALLDEINHDLNCELALRTSHKGLVVFFKAGDGTPSPVHVGQFDTFEGYRAMEQRMMLVKRSKADWVFDCSFEALSAFEEKITDAIMTFRKGRLTPRSMYGDFMGHGSRQMDRTMRGMQIYLGLRQMSHQAKSASGSKGVGSSVSMEPKRPESVVSPIFVSIDAEWKEFNSSQITELGISTLDTVDIRSIAPGSHGEKWSNFIRSHHFRISEYTTWCNRKYVKGCPDKFAFGFSRVVPQRLISDRLDEFFASLSGSGPGSANVKGKKGAASTKPTASPRRKLILVGHDPHGDIKIFADRSPLFQSLSTDRENGFLEVLDTQKLYRHFCSDSCDRSLENMLRGLGIKYQHLHNAGNDARFTLEALLRIAWESAK
ncbi:Uncharacterized protein PECH_006940 [Penicillium ucsense]|uniref:Gfd2/YDR514C-like C-terminal domain-containing protein n=1 Tax=Penicillium ucsense TaxID=2839758 RepID=A0A8J8WKK5_9EURO|nr:Uncharacterized protein PECM_005087 [Penicillium ucsense]KAF7738981.1 Uncharacterized protein PECH_006940 [Penicillium ucsense]